MPDGLRLYLDQMFGLDVAAALRREGHDVLRAAETGLARADDSLILEKAIREERILVTLDGDTGTLVTK
jgi:predicted nuclease of predicted toxin-antitoxin system